jgi:4-hydroxybenzoate polyprenyltransferase
MACYAHGTPISTVWAYVGLFLAASQVFHAAGCVINDMWDKDVDAAVRKCTFSPVEIPRDTCISSANKHTTPGFW